jgi:hypothetical protein
LGGCGGSIPAVPGPFPAATPATAKAFAAISTAGGTITFPAAAGYGGAFEYSANNAAGIVSVALVTTTSEIAELTSQSIPGTPLAAFEFTLSQSVTFQDWQGLLTTITIPRGIATAGRTFDEYGYDLTANTADGFNPGTVNGQTISFTVSSGSVTLQNHRYLLVLTAFN